jgi:hypothetical protein
MEKVDIPKPIKPPDKYHTMKCPIKNIIIDNKSITTIFDAMMRTNKIVIQSYQFLRLWILKQYHDKKIIPEITEDTIKMSFKVLTLKSKCGPKLKGNNAKILNEFTNFYDKEYKGLEYQKVDGLNLSQILEYMAVDMLTNIENNIKLNFIAYVKRFVNSLFRKINNELIENADKNTKTKVRKELNKEIFQIKEDLLNNTLESPKKYHEWINKHKINIFPKEFKNSYQFDIQNNPQKYINGMIYMCVELEKNETKMFQFFPLRTQIIPKYIPIDTKTIIELFIKENKNEYLKNIDKYKNELWSNLFNLNDSIFKQKNYIFDYRISTDCMAVSIQLLHKSLVEKEQLKKNNMKKQKSTLKEICKNMTQEEKEKYKEKLKNQEKINKENIKLKNKEKRDNEKKEFKKLIKEEQNKIKINKYIEFPYLEELNTEQIENLKKKNKVYIDPGKRCLLYMMDDSGKYLKYTNRKHMESTKRLHYKNLIENYKEKEGINKIENKLTKYNSKSCNYKKFKDFIKNKNKINDKLISKYTNEKFRKYKWYSFINKKKSETKLVNEIKKTFGKDIIICYGDWSIGKQMRNYISTPNLGLKRKLGEHFTIYSIDEFRTSLLNHKTEEINENLVLPDKKGVIRNMHSILTYKMENKRMGCINRDKNSVKNMIKLTNYYLEHKDRPEKFKRTFKFEDKKVLKNKKTQPKIKLI